MKIEAGKEYRFNENLVSIELIDANLMLVKIKYSDGRTQWVRADLLRGK